MSTHLSDNPILREDFLQILADNEFRRTGKQTSSHEEWESPKGELFLIPHLERLVPSDFVYLILKKIGVNPLQSDLYRPLIFEVGVESEDEEE